MSKLAYKTPKSGEVLFLTDQEAAAYRKNIGQITRYPEKDVAAAETKPTKTAKEVKPE